jgi:hypothetical protein
VFASMGVEIDHLEMADTVSRNMARFTIFSYHYIQTRPIIQDTYNLTFSTPLKQQYQMKKSNKAHITKAMQ